MLNKIAKTLVKKNPELKTIVLENEKSYKLLEERVTTRLVAAIGRQEGTFVSRNKLIWAIIDEVNGTSKAELKY